MTKRHLQIVPFSLFILAYLGFLLYFLTIRTGDILVVWILTAFASGGMVMMAIYGLTLYMFRQREKAALYFSLLCISISVRFFTLEGSETIQGLIPSFPASVVLFIQYISIALMTIGIHSFVYEIFIKPKHRRTMYVLNIIVFALHLVCGIIDAMRSDNNYFITRFCIFLAVFIVLIHIAVQVFRSPELRKNRLNWLYFISILFYIAMTVLHLFFINIFSHTAVFNNSFFVIVHVILLSERYSRTINENEFLDRLNRTKSELFTTMSHEMRTPLTVMSAYAQYAVKEIKKKGATEQTLADLATISGEAKRLAEMADGTLKIFLSESESSTGEQKKKPLDKSESLSALDIGDLSKRIVRLFEPIALRNKQKLFVEIKDDTLPVLGYADALTQVLWNILQNAVTHSMCKNIYLTIEADSISDKEKVNVKITVKDDGCGIDADLLPYIFDRGSAGKKNESAQSSGGIGLSICREIIQRHGGDINIQSEIGSGTIVTIILPGGKNV